MSHQSAASVLAGKAKIVVVGFAPGLSANLGLLSALRPSQGLGLFLYHINGFFASRCDELNTAVEQADPEAESSSLSSLDYTGHGVYDSHMWSKPSHACFGKSHRGNGKGNQACK